MRAVHWLFLLRIAALIALGTSVALVIDYLSPLPTFCSDASGCAAVRQSGWGTLHISGGRNIPLLPMSGVFVFALLFGLSLLNDPAKRARFVGPLAFGAAPVGLLLLGLQAALGSFCSLCVVVDLMSLVVGCAAYGLRGDGWEVAAHEDTLQMRVIDVDELFTEGQRVRAVWTEDSRIYSPPTPLVRPAPGNPLRLERWTWYLLALLAVMAPLLYPFVVQKSAAPAVITSLHVPGKINVVEFFDFQCPHCRELAPRLDALLEPYGNDVHFVRRYVPLAQHGPSREASKMAICADEQGLGGLLSEAFMRAPDFSGQNLETLAQQVGVRPERMRECLASSRPDQRLREDRARLQRAGFEGLPTTYVGGVRILGAASNEVYQDALIKVSLGRDKQGVSPLVYWASFGLSLLGMVLLGRKRPPAHPLRSITQH